MSQTGKRTSQASGKTGELLAQTYLEEQGYILIDINVHFGRTSGVDGEIDIVAWEKDTLCFIEVKTRQSNDNALAPAAAVTPQKQRQLTRLATLYALHNELLGDGETPMRFDVVAVMLPVRRDAQPTIELLRGAFAATEEEI